MNGKLKGRLLQDDAVIIASTRITFPKVATTKATAECCGGIMPNLLDASNS